MEKVLLTAAAATDLQTLHLEVQFVDQITSKTIVVGLEQRRAGLRVFDSDLRAVVEGGNLVAVNGVAHLDNGNFNPDVLAEVIDPLALVEAEVDDQILSVSTSNDGHRIVASTLSSGNVTVELGLTLGEDLVWKLLDTEATILTDALSGDVIARASNYQHAWGNEYANITFRDYGLSPELWHPTNTRVSAKRAYWSDNGSPSRTFWLAYLNVGYPIGQVLDGNSAQVSVDAPAGTTAQFNSTTAVNLEQQTMFYMVSLVRDYFNWYVFPSVAPDHNRPLTKIYIDMPWYYCGACYNTVTEAIYFRADTSDRGAGVIWHEYGHAVNDMYGQYSENCIQGSDEGNALSETTADIISFAMGRRYAGVTYSDAWARIGNGTQKQHTNGSTLVKHGDFHCSSSSYYDVGIGFEQAAWEIMNNLDCSDGNDVPCSSSPPDWGSDIGWSNTGAARLGVLRAMVYAKRTLPPSTTFASMASWMYSYWKSNYSINLANAADAVMQHHGY